MGWRERIDLAEALLGLPGRLPSRFGVNAGGSIATNYTYQPFEATTIGGATNGNTYQFTGRENDGTGLYFYRSRYYSPNVQRFNAQIRSASPAVT